MSLTELGLIEAAAKIRDGEIRSEELVTACLDHIDGIEGQVKAWVFLDRDYALAQAKAADEQWARQESLGPLHGVPVGIKDIIDVDGLPSGRGTPLSAENMPKRDAALVSLLRQAGAVIMGKTVTTELAVYHPGKTRNPHNVDHTPGGSSMGSAASVASFMVPGAVGTQTNGSVIRPASYCGIVGFKPSHGLIPRPGVLDLSRTLDTMGAMGRSVDDAAILTECMIGWDDEDPDTRIRARPRLLDAAREEPPVAPDFVFMKTAAWEKVEDECRDAFAELADFLGDRCDADELPDFFAAAWDYHRTIMCADMARGLADYYENGRDQLSSVIVGMIEEGQKSLATDYLKAHEWRQTMIQGMDSVFEEYDAILTPAATGTAPRGLDATGDPVCSTLWTYLGLPCITLPLMQGENGLPIGVQLVGAPGRDGRLLRTANWLARQVAQQG
ncbi:MAG: amidase [Rhodospirillaceae bacterium]